MDEIQAYQGQFDAETLGQVSLQEADKETTIETAGCNCLKISATPGSRNSLQTYSRQCEDAWGHFPSGRHLTGRLTCWMSRGALRPHHVA